MSQNNFDQVCPSGNTMIDGFQEPEPISDWKCEGCEKYFENEEDLQEHNNMYLCEGCIDEAIEEAEANAESAREESELGFEA